MGVIEDAIRSGGHIWEKALEYERGVCGKSEAEILSKMQSRIGVMRQAAMRGTAEEMSTRSGMVCGNAKKFYDSTCAKTPMCGKLVGKAISYALAVSEVNASMGLIVAAPTAGSCGILPGALLALNEEVGGSQEKLSRAFLTASGVGLFIAGKATFAAAVAGCGAEIGASAAMASAAIVEFNGGSAKEAVNAGAISLKSYLGLVCDPVAGLVEVPCIKRNAIGVANAFAAADMALAGIESAIPFDEVVGAMYRIGKRLPVELRETSKGGLATTPTGLKIMGRIYQIAE